jgi:tetratricopeptide (TPR) repeat protein
MRYIPSIFIVLISFQALGYGNPDDSVANLLRKAASVEERITLLNNSASAVADIDLKKSFEYATEALTLAQRSANETGRAYAFLNLGKYYSRMGMHETAMQNFLLTLEISHQQLDDKLIGLTYKAIGNDYFAIADYAMARQYYRRSLVVATRIRDEETTADLQNNIALGFINSHKDSALIYLQKALKTCEKLQNPGKIANVLLNIGEVKDRSNLYHEAIYYFKRSLTISRPAGLKLHECFALNNICMSLIHLKKYDDAEQYIMEALTIAQQAGFKSFLLNVYENLHSLHKEKKNFAVALAYHEKLLALKKDLLNEQKTRQIEELRTKYESEQKDRENETLQQEAKFKEEQLTLTRLLLLFSGIFAVAVTILAVIYYRSLVHNKRAKNILIELNQHIQTQQEKIAAQAEEVNRTNREIALINENLEALVREKTLKITRQNEKLIVYAFHNAHRVRGPLARILGLVGLTKIGAINQRETDFILDEIHNASAELDVVIKEITQVLEEDKLQ